MELTEHSCKRCGGSLNSIGENRWKCQYCGRVYDEESALKNTKTMSELFDQKEKEVVNNLRRNLYDAVNAEFISNKDVKAACVELKKHLPDDFAANFYEVACSDNLRAITQKVRKINVEESADEIESVINFLIKSLQIDFLLELNNLVERAYKNTDLKLYENYATLISVEAEKVQNGIYETKLPREVFIAYSSKDMDKVSELCEVLESQGLQCFVAARNLRHGKGSVENYDKALKEAMDHCKSFVFVSSLNSRQFSCDALGIEIPYIESLDKENAPAEYRNNYISIPHKFKKPRVEYRVEESRGFNAADGITNEFFDGYERVYSPEEVAGRILKQLVEVPVVETPAPEKKPEVKKICVACGTENTQSASYCTKCRGNKFVANVSEYIKIKNQQELEERRKREEERKKEEERRRAAAASSAPKSTYTPPKPTPQPPKKKSKAGLVVFLILAGIALIIAIAAGAGSKRNDTISPGEKTEGVLGETFEASSAYPNEYQSDFDPNQTDDPYGGDAEQESGIYVEEYDDLTFTISTDGTMTVSGTGEIKDFDGVESAPWHNYFDLTEYSTGYEYSSVYAPDFVKKIVIEEGITSIGRYAFYDFDYVVEVVLPESVKIIGDQAFYCCYNLQTIDLSCVEELKDRAFYECNALTSVDLSSVRRVGAEAFGYCDNLSGVSMGDSVEKVREYAFVGTQIYSESMESNSYFIIDHCVIKVDPSLLVGVVDGSMFVDVVCIADHACVDSSNLISITLPESLKHIGDYAFQNAYGLTSLNIPASVISIGEKAFSSCTAMTSVTIAEGSQLKEIGTGAFSNCNLLASAAFPADISVEVIGDEAFYGTSLTEVILPATVKSIGDRAFYACSSLKKVVIPEGSALEIIGEQAFCSCTALESISFPNESALVEIGAEAFSACDSLIQVNLPASLTTIGNYAFSGCDKLSNVIIPTSVTLIGEYAFNNSYYIESILYLGTQDEWNSIVKGNGWDSYAGNYTSSGSVVVLCMNGEYDPSTSETFTSGLSFSLIGEGTAYTVKRYSGTETEVIIPSVYNGLPVTAIRDGAFNDTAIVSVTIPASITEIGNLAFQSCVSLTSINFAEDTSLTKIGEGAFKCCETLTEIRIPYSVESMGREVFYGCIALANVLFDDGIELATIPTYAFYDCEALATVDIPDSVVTIDTYAFQNSGIVSLSFGENTAIETLGAYSFANCDSLKTVILPNTLTSSLNNVFYSSNAIESVTCTVLQIPYIAKTSLKSVVFLPEVEVEGVTPVHMISDNLFNGNDVIESVVMSEDMTSIGYRAFYDCDALVSVTFSENLTSIGQEAFGGCALIKAMDIPDTVTSIGKSAFANCDLLRSVSLPASITENGGYLFDGCDALEEVILADGIKSLGEHTFQYCSALTTIELPESLETIGVYAFNGTGLVSVTVPESVTSIDSRAFGDCDALETITVYGNPTVNADYTFYDCASIKSVTIHADLIPAIPKSNLVSAVITEGDIPNSAFSGCKKLISVELPSDTEGLVIGTYAFNNCSSLMSITIPANIGGIGESSFSGCSRLVEVINLSTKSIVAGDASTNGGIGASALIVHDGESLLDKIGDYVFITVDEVNYLVSYIGNDAEITFPESYNGEKYTPCPSIFENNKTITSVTIRGIDKVSDRCFYNCTTLKTVVIEDGVLSIGDSAFQSCDELASVTIGNDVSVIGSQAFYECTKLKTLTIGSGLEWIKQSAFYYCSALTKISLPASILQIDGGAFRSCGNLLGVSFADTSYKWKQIDDYGSVVNSAYSVEDSSVNASTFLGSYTANHHWTREDHERIVESAD